MKKRIILFGLIIAGFVLPSCKKNYTCTCNLIPTKQKFVYQYNALKSEAQETCDEQNKAMKLTDTTGASSCVLSKD